jgi:hypothetical protein
MTATMTSTTRLTLTPEMNELRMKYFLHDPIVHEERVKYLHATMVNIMVNYSDHFKYFFGNDKEHLILLLKWIAEKEEGPPFTDKEMLGIYVLNSCPCKYLALAIFKEQVLGIFDEKQFYEDFGVPKAARHQRRQPKDILKNELKQ